MAEVPAQPEDDPAPAAADLRGRPPLVVHVVHRLDYGGMENGLVNLINRTPPDRFRHAVVCLKDFTDFRARIADPGVPVLALGKRDGKDVAIYWRLWRALRRLAPDIAHTRNLPAVDMAAPAALAGVPVRIHGEHGRDVTELGHRARKYAAIRRAVSPLVDRYIPLSRELEDWLANVVGVPRRKIVRIYNGVDGERFRPAQGGREPLPRPGFAPPDAVVIGAVGRMATVKNQPLLARAFAKLAARADIDAAKLRLVMVGDGPLRPEVEAIIAAAGLGERVWLAGARDDIPAFYRGFDIFALPSDTEGISNTILEAMASGLPVVATDVGGNPELVVDGETGRLTPAGDPQAMADALAAYVVDAALRRRHGAAARARIEARFTLEAMVERYLAVYDEALAAKGRARR